MSTGPESLQEAADRLERIAPGYLELVRRRAAELGLPPTREARARRTVELVAQAAPIDATPPIASARRIVQAAKRGVGTLVRFYALHLAGQVSTLGDSTALMGEALCDYVAGLEREVSELRERVARLEGRPDAP